MNASRTADRAAIGVSIGCIVHCLAGPVLLAFAPSLALLAEAEWVHELLAGVAIVLAMAVALATTGNQRRRFVPPAMVGATCLLLGLLAGEFGLDDRLPTILGATLLAYAHLARFAASAR